MGSHDSRGFSFLLKIGDEDFTHKLIPTDLIKHFNGVVPDEAILRTSSSGPCWFIKLKRVEENLFFQQGWSDFVKDNSVQFGDSLLLGCIGNSQFSVKIFGRNGGEKKLPLSGVKRSQQPKSNEKVTKRRIDFDCKDYCEAKLGRDSAGASKNKKTCGPSKCVESPRRRVAVNNERTGLHEVGCSFKANCPYFILGWTPQKGYRAEIPEKFLREVGGRLPVAVLLKDHGGIIWPIGLRKADGRVWFEHGWKQFIEHHSISQHFLIFRYDCNSEFDVSIINIRNNSADEMKDLDYFEHPEAPNVEKRCELNEEDRNTSAYGTRSRYKNMRSNGSVSSSEKRANTRSKKKRSSGDKGKMREVFDVDESDQTKQQSEESSPGEGIERTHGSSIHHEDKEESLESVRQEEIQDEDHAECFDGSSSSSEVSVVAKKRAVNMKRNKKKKSKNSSATQLASEFKSQNPFFIVNLQPYNLKYKFLPIPVNFSNQIHLLNDQAERMVKLEVSDGRTWLVKCMATGPTRRYFRLSKGLAKFINSNNLLAGDVCIFEAIEKKPNVVLKVHIFHCLDMD